MEQLALNSATIGIVISLLGYELGLYLKRKLGYSILNPLLISILFVVGCIHVFHVSYDTYRQSAQYLSYLLTPATVCLAIPLYMELSLLKENMVAILLGILSGVLTSFITILCGALIFHFDHAQYVTLLPKSITTAIGMGISKELGGYVPITVVVISMTGVFGNMVAETLCKLFRITHPIAKGVGIGTAAHAIGTTRAMEMGEVEGAMSGLSLVIAGLCTLVAASLFGNVI